MNITSPYQTINDSSFLMKSSGIQESLSNAMIPAHAGITFLLSIDPKTEKGTIKNYSEAIPPFKGGVLALVLAGGCFYDLVDQSKMNSSK